MSASNKIKRTVAAVAAASALAVGSLPSKALALDFPFGDFGFVVYGGNNERYENMLSSTVLEQPVVTGRNISPDLPALQAGATLGLRYMLFGTTLDGINMYISSASPTLSSAQQANSLVDVAGGALLFWGAQLGTQTGGSGNPYAQNPTIVPSSFPQSFTTMLGNDGSVSGFLGFTTHASPDQPLTIFRVNVDGETPVFTPVASALLTGNGQLTITPNAVPVPAAVILFGTGLIGLVGIARRKMADAHAA